MMTLIMVDFWDVENFHKEWIEKKASSFCPSKPWNIIKRLENRQSTLLISNAQLGERGHRSKRKMKQCAKDLGPFGIILKNYLSLSIFSFYF